MSQSDKMAVDAPNRFPWPPVLTIAAIAAGWLMGRLVPWHFTDESGWLALAGYVLIGLAILIDVWALMTFRRHRANIRPDRPATKLIVDGPFTFSRNPIYLANVLLTAGLGLALGNRWLVLGAAILFVLLQELAIKPEERHLRRLFPDLWTTYSALVRRWL